MWPRLMILFAILLSPAVASGDDTNGMTDASPDTSQYVSPDIDTSRDVPPNVSEDPYMEPPDATDTSTKDKKCRAAWKKYRESMACFARYRVVGGGVKEEAFKHCKNMVQPDLCE
jgi:hypothetical protein